MALLDVGTLASLATALTLVVALVFGALQVNHARGQRRQEALNVIIRAMQTSEITRPARLLMELPIEAPAERIEADPALKEAASSVIVFLEGSGMMVHSRTVDLHDLDRAMGGVARGLWRRLRPYVEARREKEQDPNFGEWFQWLVERMEEDPAPGKADGAHVSYRGWRR